MDMINNDKYINILNEVFKGELTAAETALANVAMKNISQLILSKSDHASGKEIKMLPEFITILLYQISIYMDEPVRYMKDVTKLFEEPAKADKVKV